MKLIILDRDGTINEDSDAYIKSADEWTPLPGALESIAKLNQAGWTVTVATNQSGLAQGLFNQTTLEAMHQKMHGLLKAVGGQVDSIFYCPHASMHGCECRKPRSGLFQQIAAHYGVSLTGVPTVGDTLRDLQAGTALGCEPHLVLTGKGQRQNHSTLPSGTQIHTDLAAMVSKLLAGK